MRLVESAHWTLALALFLSPLAAHPQSPSPTPTPLAEATQLPDSPGYLKNPQPESPTVPESVVSVAKASFASSGTKPPPCQKSRWIPRITASNPDDTQSNTPTSTLSCVNILNPYVRFLDTRFSIPMTPAQKGYLAFRNLTDPFNLATIAAVSAFTIGIDSHTAYGPGFKGFGKLSGVSFVQDATGEFFGTFLIPSLAREDPHYHREPRSSVPRRIFHAVSRTVVAQQDDGTLMPNYATLLTYPITAEISNLYVPGIQTDGPATVKRVLIGYALDPVNNIVTEFLPDVARRVHIRVIFVQRIINQVTANTTGTTND
jgi:hypothetical protein